MDEDRLLDQFEKDLWLTSWQKEDLPILLAILEEIMLLIDKSEDLEKWNKLELYYLFFKEWGKSPKLTKMWFDSIDKIHEWLVKNWVIPNEQKMQELIEERKKIKNKAHQVKTQVWGIIWNN